MMTSSTLHYSYDVIVIGGSTAGMAAAIYARLKGLRVLLFDHLGESYDKPCGEGLMPLALKHLNTLGVTLTEGSPVRGILQVSNDKRALGIFSGLQTHGLGVRRRHLRSVLWARARELGVDVREQMVVQIHSVESGMKVVEAYQAHYVVLATGLKSALTRSFPSVHTSKTKCRFGFRRHLQMKPWSDLVEVYWHAKGELYVTPVGPSTINIAILLWESMSFDEALDLFPDVKLRMHDHQWEDEAAGVGPFFRKAKFLQKDSVLLVGDAAGFVDPMTGEGNSLALGSGMAAIDSILNRNLTDYPMRWWQLAWRYWILTRVFLWATVPGWRRFFTVRLISRIAGVTRWSLRFMNDA